MTNPLSTLPRIAASLMIVLLAVATVDGRVVRRDARDRTYAALDVFNQRVEAYAALHRRVAASLPLVGSSLDRRSLTVARALLSSAIIAARPTASQGDIFAPDAAHFFRMVIRETTSAADVGKAVPLMDEDGRVLPGIHPGIHTPFPVWEMRELPASTLFMLPTLPPELEYRVVDYDLVLWDVTADLIIDVLPYAVPHPASDAIYR
jgi:hypothetical protein